MTALNIIRRIIFWSTIVFIISSILALTIGQILPIEFRDIKMHSDYYYLVFTVFPFSFLLTLFGTIKRKNTKSKNWAIGIMTVLSAGLCFLLLFNVMFSVGFGAWTNLTILYRNIKDKDISINHQNFDIGALGYRGDRIVKVTPFLKYFQTIQQVDTTKIDTTQWVYVNEDGDMKLP